MSGTPDFSILLPNVGQAAIGCTAKTHVHKYRRQVPGTDPVYLDETGKQLPVGS
jgi:hypothetical protein